MARHKKSNQQRSGLSVLFLGVVLSGIMLAAVSFILAFLSYRMENPTAMTGIISLASLLLTAALMGFIISKLKGDGGMLISVLSSLLFCLILLTVGLIGTGGKLPLFIPLNYLCYMGVSALFAFLGKKREKRGRHR